MLLLALAGSGLAPAAADAARAWTHTAAAPYDAFSADAAVTALDESVIVWNKGGGATYAEIRPRGGGDGPDALLDAGPTYTPEVVTDGAGGASAVWLAYEEAYGYRIRVADRLPGGPFGPAADIANATNFIDAASNARGDLAILYEWYNAAFAAKRYYVAFRPAGAAFLPAQPIAGDIPEGDWWYTAGVAVSPEGELAVGWRDGPWDTGGRTWVARRPAGGAAFGAPQQLSAPGARSGVPAVAYDTAGRALAAWPESVAGEHSGPMRAAIAQPALPFGPARQIGPDGHIDDAPAVAAGAGGSAVVSWAEYHATSEEYGDGSVSRGGSGADTRAVRADLVTGTFSDALSVSLDLGARPVVALKADGTPSVFYEDFRTNQLRIARGNDAGGFDAPETIHCPRPYGSPATAFFDTHGDAGLLWQRWSHRPLPAYMLARDAEAEEQSPSSCPAVPPGFTVTPEVAPPGTSRRLDLSNSVEPGEEGKRFSWDLDDDGVFEIEESEQPYVDHVFETRGRHTVNYRVHSDDGWSDGNALIKVTDPPTASLRAVPEEPETGEIIELDASESADPDGEIVSYRWDGDGDANPDWWTTEPKTPIAFYEPGDHKVTVWAEDDLGAEASAEVVIHVREAEDEGGSGGGGGDTGGGGGDTGGGDGGGDTSGGDGGGDTSGGGGESDTSGGGDGAGDRSGGGGGDASGGDLSGGDSRGGGDPAADAARDAPRLPADPILSSGNNAGARLDVRVARRQSARSVRRRGVRVRLVADRTTTVVLRAGAGAQRRVTLPAGRVVVAHVRPGRRRLAPGTRLRVIVAGVRHTVVVGR
ncbi:MAG TPA: PKD domain-containing protein [Solirubrobacteraceae bacterium]